MSTEQKPKIDTNADVVNQYTGEKWYYTDIVKEHFFNPRNLMLEDPDESQYQAIGMVGSPACGDMMKMWLKIEPQTEKVKEMKWRTFGCLPLGQLVYAPGGFRPIEQFDMGDPIFAGDGRVWEVLEPSSREYRGPLMRIVPLVSKFNAFTVTPEHPVYVIRRRNLPGARKQYHTKFRRVTKDSLENAEAEYIAAQRLEQGDFLIYRYPVVEKDIAKLTPEVLRLLGYYLSEGYFSANDKKGNYGVLAFAFNKKETDLIQDTSNILFKIFGKKAKTRTRENVAEVYICSREAIRFMNYYCGHYASRKLLHPDLMLLPSSKQKILLEAYIRGDGAIHQDHRGNRGNTTYCVTTSRELAYQLQVIIARTGYFAKILERKAFPSVIDGRQIKGKVQFMISFIKNPTFKSIVKRYKDCFAIPIARVETILEYGGRVYNLMVNSKNPSYLVNGFVVHNCGSAIAATSMFSVMVTENGGLPMDEALKIKPQHIMERLGGLPNRKIHCSVLADKAFRKAANEYFRRTGQVNRIIIEGARVIDAKLNITDKDIEEAVLEGAVDLDGVQKKLKVGVGSPEIITEVEQLIRFYKEKYYG